VEDGDVECRTRIVDSVDQEADLRARGGELGNKRAQRFTRLLSLLSLLPLFGEVTKRLPDRVGVGEEVRELVVDRR